ncbi:DUF2189 domain-containing protein [Pseudoprimorskyibacter insulae]|uniref:DUF2189 domain-containing protein n=1 Tax=Pseudoprimorskyibacter insulae TaxID=1695997 RepID=A0A2R8AXM5_9RHOB|nr:DUF2189 domain-containing protein [Pseudoprimorskyibacter insulae]SPF80707.1 hypothetical protein PRI8871_02518 [Pseudoprimorskyibacter insulae]
MPTTPKPGVPDLGDVSLDLLKEALRRGWRDQRRTPGFGLIFSAVYVVCGWGMWLITWATGQSYWMIFAAVGFPLLGPFAAVGFYDVSRRLEQGLPLDWMQIFGVIASQSKRQLPSICAIIIIVFLFWFFLAHMIFALFMGLSTMTNVSSSVSVFLTGNGLIMLLVELVLGALTALLIYMLTVIALPMLLDREIDFVTAMITSFGFVKSHLFPMLIWGVMIAGLTLVAMVPIFLGLFLILPLLGHATWHLYDMLAYGKAHPAAEHTAT